MRTIKDLADEYLISYKLRHPRSATFAEYALGHVKRLLGDKMLVDINEETVKEYQESRQSGASDQTIMDIAGHLSKQMLKHYSHIRIEAKCTALESIVQKQPARPAEPKQDHSPVPTVKQQIEGEYPQKSPQSGDSGKACRGKADRSR